MQKNDPQRPTKAEKAVVLHTLGVQVGLGGFRASACGQAVVAS